MVYPTPCWSESAGPKPLTRPLEIKSSFTTVYGSSWTIQAKLVLQWLGKALYPSCLCTTQVKVTCRDCFIYSVHSSNGEIWRFILLVLVWQTSSLSGAGSFAFSPFTLQGLFVQKTSRLQIGIHHANQGYNYNHLYLFLLFISANIHK